MFVSALQPLSARAGLAKVISESGHPQTIQGELLSLISASPEALRISSSGPQLTNLSGTALKHIFLRAGYICFGSSEEVEGCRVEMFCNLNREVVELTVRTELVEDEGRAIVLLLLMPQERLIEVSAGAAYLGADLCRMGNLWYAVVNTVSPDRLVDYTRQVQSAFTDARGRRNTQQWDLANAA